MRNGDLLILKDLTRQVEASIDAGDAIAGRSRCLLPSMLSRHGSCIALQVPGTTTGFAARFD